jgi:acyl-coenzyme A synthetase/AMP-(fatty) acid ligase
VVKQLIAISIGEPLRPDIAAKITEGGRTTLLHLYGTTETPGSTGIRYDDKKIGDISIGMATVGAAAVIYGLAALITGALRISDIRQALRR